MKPVWNALWLAAALGAAAPAAHAERYPDKPVRVVVAFPPGGNADLVVRAISDRLSTELGVPVVVDNRPGGAAGVVGTAELARAPADGYTIGVATVGSMGTPPAVSSRLPYDPLKNFSFISNLATVPMILVVGPSVKDPDVGSLLRTLKADQGKRSYASGGVGGIAHLMGELFKVSTGAQMVHVPYRGSGPALGDLAGGQVDLLFDATVSSLPHVQSGRIRSLAVSGAARVPTLPDVPTFAEAGFPDISTEVWYGLVGPADIPADRLQRLHQAVVNVLAQPVVRQRLEQQGAMPLGNSPAQFREQVAREVAKWKRVAATQKISVD